MSKPRYIVDTDKRKLLTLNLTLIIHRLCGADAAMFSKNSCKVNPSRYNFCPEIKTAEDNEPTTRVCSRTGSLTMRSVNQRASSSETSKVTPNKIGYTGAETFKMTPTRWVTPAQRP